MEKPFKNTLKSRFPFLCGKNLLLAVSGGLDSVVLAYLCKAAKLEFSIAHCNFNLRGEESDGDEDFVIDLADELEVEVFIQNFDTEAFAEEAKISIQMAARELRYNWFRELSDTLKFEYILTAHHANDELETFLINLVRGTGLEGLSGILIENDKIVRPMLNFTRKEIETYARDNNIKWREDSSNASTKYLRNKIRHNVVPVLEELNPQLLQGFLQTQAHLKESEALIEDYISLIYPKVVKSGKFGYMLDIEYLKKIPNTKAILYQLLKSFGFTEWDDVHNLLDAQPGKIVYSEDYRLIKDRETLILTEINHTEDKIYNVTEGEEVVMLPMGRVCFRDVEEIDENRDNTRIFVAKEKLQFPLKIRKWKIGDYFYPFGMKGRKKISDFFKDKKMSLPEKENTWLLCSGEEIVWVINYRADDRFAITSENQKILKISCCLQSFS
ncbi:tRNA lysidine(34) synthetase TilS [Salegentibacter sp. F188]|uniref:tRNA(Ile)-lysidine synthase n=1 Tax=Autumnicola patrickiae TaxID=3075591 RepID=A0ABU3DWV3_9FLAO|nr:tRNA lysidine(34) synthetase TilS [Salegentibacter sp. F188]MDT0688208.1 tRNA lysidine(34) synthetase TilS [Salegentibacter sp. F188]